MPCSQTCSQTTTLGDSCIRPTFKNKGRADLQLGASGRERRDGKRWRGKLPAVMAQVTDECNGNIDGVGRATCVPGGYSILWNICTI